MTPQQIKANAPEGATHYCKYKGRFFYFFKSNYGFRQIEKNIIQFQDPNADHLIKPL